MPKQQREPGYRVTILLTEDVERAIQRERKFHKKVNGALPSRSAIVNTWLREYLKRPDSLKMGTNGQ